MKLRRVKREQIQNDKEKLKMINFIVFCKSATGSKKAGTGTAKDWEH